jgi:penicillin amidase
LDGLGPAAADDETSRLRRYLESWNGRADVESTGLPLLVEFRQTLIDAVISPIVAECRKADPSFIYYWSGADEPVRRIIDSKRSELLPERATYHDWPEFIRAKLSESARRLLEKNGVASLSELTWGKAYPVEIRHSVAGGIPLLGRLFNMPRSPLAGCQHCVRFLFSNPIGLSGANSRMVVSPGREEDGILQMIGGQSGQLGSAHYSDQQADWVSGRARALRIGEARSRIILEPGDH